MARKAVVVVRYTLIALGLSVSAVAWAADTGPEYLEDEPEQNPINSGFILLQLPFETDRENTLRLRTFYQDRTLDGLQDRENWAGGGWLNVVGSYFDEAVKISGTMYTSQKLYGPDDKAETGALQPVHNGYSALGELYASLTLDRVALQAGRFEVELPYVNTHDIRMTPQTFQGSQALYKVNEDWDIGVGVLTDIKRRTREGFDSLYEAAGLDGNENVILGGSLYEFGPGTYAGLYALHAPDYHNGVYAEVSKRFSIGDERYVQFSGQYTYQDATGDELDGDFTVHHYGARATWKDGWYSGSLAWTDYPEEDRLRKPWGGIPGYTSVMVGSFDRPEETAWLIGGTVDFDSLGVRGLSVNAKAIYGDTPDCGTAASPDHEEYNLNFNYRPVTSLLAGLFLQLRFSWVDQDETCLGGDDVDVTEIRFVANYSFEF